MKIGEVIFWLIIALIVLKMTGIFDVTTLFSVGAPSPTTTFMSGGGGGPR